ncbi:MAG: NADH-quinone oxidoreductase subunit NuoN [Brachymonas sp.]|nr:NADH-quinone oxidoreductase subunit NuoN [Brachymonas sp.]
MIDATSWAVIAPEVALLSMACLITLADLWVRSPRRAATYWLTQATLLLLALWQARYAFALLPPAAAKTAYWGFGNMALADALGSTLKCMATLALMATLVYARPYAAQRGMLQRGGELFTLSLFGLLGIYIMASGNHFLLIYLGLEMTSLASFALVALWRNNSLAAEAGMKYFILGALASGFLLYGLSMVYGATGTMYLSQVLLQTMQQAAQTPVLMLGLVFIVAGLAFKLGAVPFHMWIPDVYQGAPTAASLFVATAPKLGVFAVLLRLLVGGLLDLAPHWQLMMVVLGVCSLLVGNLAAIMQSNLKRMLAYSTIAQNGFMLLVFAVSHVHGNNHLVLEAMSASLFYLIGYVLAAAAAFGLLMLLSREGFECENLQDLSGLNRRYPLYAGIMSLSMLSLAGVPLTVGFYGKFRVIQVLLAAQTPLHTILAVFAVLTSVIGAFYYLRVIKTMYFDAEQTPADVPLAGRYDAHAVLSLNGALLLVLGVLPAGLLRLCELVVRHMSGIS